MHGEATFDGEFPQEDFKGIMNHIGLDPQEFTRLCDHFWSPPLWKQEDGRWVLRHSVQNL